MLKPLFCLFIFGALLHGAVSDIKCYLDGLLPMVENLSMGQQIDSLNCLKVKVNMANLTELAKTCSSKVDISKLNSLIDDICNTDSKLYKKYLENKPCLDSKSASASTGCILANVDVEGSTDVVENMKKVCPLFEPYFKCWNEKIGVPCGKDGSRVMETITDAMSSFTKSVCDEVNGVSATSAVSWVVLLGILLVMTLQKY